MTTENNEFETVIEKLVTGGAGLGRHDGLAAFIPDTAPGDRVRAEVVRPHKHFVEARLLEILEAGPGRRSDTVSDTLAEGGCTLGHLTGEAQRQAKRDIVCECFQRLGKLDVSDLLEGPDDTGGETGYRNKIRLFASPTGLYGTVRPGSHDVIPLQNSLLMPELFNDRILPWLIQLPPVDQVIVRLDGRGGWLILLYGRPGRLRPLRRIIKDMTGDDFPAPGCQGIVFNGRPVWGRDYLIVQVAGHKYRVSAKSFFQANLAVTEAAVAKAINWLDELRPTGGLLADLYCGVGLFSLALADRFERVVAADTDPVAIRDARNNVQRESALKDRVDVRKARTADVLSAQDIATDEEWAEACVLVDPPRKGLGDRATAELVRRKPRHILYMSCDPATLARDTARLLDAGYEIGRLRAFDMFPQTAHVETLLLLQRPA